MRPVTLAILTIGTCQLAGAILGACLGAAVALTLGHRLVTRAPDPDRR